MIDELPNEAPTPMPPGVTSRLLNNLAKLTTYLSAVQMPLAAMDDLGPRGIWVLRCIGDGVAYPSDIAQIMMVGPSLVTSDLQRLLKAGLLVRAANPADRRRIRYRLTDRGRSLLDAAFALYDGLVRPKFASHDPADVEAFFRILDDLSEPGWLGLGPQMSKQLPSAVSLQPTPETGPAHS